MANSLSTLETNIADDTKRSTTTDKAAIGRFIISSIDYYLSKRWWVTEAEGTAFNTASGTEYYAIPSNLRVVDSVDIDATGTHYPLEQKTNEYIEDRYVDASTHIGYPQVYSIFKNRIRMYPIPNGTYAVKTQGYGGSLPTYSTDESSTWVTDTASVWANELYELIYCRARKLMERNYLYNAEGYAIFNGAENEEFVRLSNENVQRAASSRLRGWGIV